MNLLSSTSLFSFFTIISRIFGYVRDILIAIFLGASIFADAFFVAFRLPNTFRRLFAEGTFNAAFIPSYIAAKIQDKKKIWRNICKHIKFKKYTANQTSSYKTSLIINKPFRNGRICTSRVLYIQLNKCE